MWKPMETAPIDGLEDVLLALDDGSVSPGHYDDGLDCDGRYCVDAGWIAFNRLDCSAASPVAWQPYSAHPGLDS